MLFGRAEESGVIQDLLRAARAGRGGALVLRGGAGIGKTALLEAAIAAARAERMQVVAARGTEGESELPHATLADLATPLLEPLDAIPAPQASALRGALALAPPVPGDRFAVAARRGSRVSAAAAARPLALVVDDLQWVDPASAEALLFAARRLAPVRVAMLLAQRDDDPGDPAPEGLPSLHVGGLGRDAAADLLAARAGAAPAPSVVERAMRDTGGNPLALSEVAEWMGPAEIDGRRPLPELLPIGGGLARALARRLDPLPAATRRALVVAAAADPSATGAVARAVAALELPPGALAPAEQRGVLAVRDGRIAWRHPLMRAAVHAEAPAREWREAHAALAAVTEGSARAWHLAAAGTAPDAGAADALDAAGRDALRRGAPAEAGHALRRAAELSPDPPSRTSRLLAAADALALAGRHSEALPLLDEGEAAGAAGHAVRAARAAILAAAGEARAARAILEPEARALADRDPGTAGALNVLAAMTAAIAADVPGVTRLARRGVTLLDVAGAPEPSRAAARAFLAQGLILGGDTAAGRPLLDEAAACLAVVGEAAHPPLTRAVVLGHLWIGDLAEARLILDRLIDEARSGSAVGALPYPLAVRAVADARAGRWDAAAAGGGEAALLARETGQPSIEALAGVGPAHVAAGRADVPRCDALADRIDALSEAAGADSLLLHSAAARGLARLGAGDAEGAVVHLERADRLARERGVANPSAVPYAADLVEALLRAGRPGDAEAAAERLRAAAARAGDAWSCAAAARARALTGRGDAARAAFAAALAHAGEAMPFERARTDLLLGEHLRRVRRPGEARAHLRAAREAFARLGADAWGRRASTELRAAGDARGSAGAPSGLTPQEARIAGAVARGATNREVASELSLSPKTVEHHLGRVYAKLGVRSRTELALLLSRGGPVESADP